MSFFFCNFFYFPLHHLSSFPTPRSYRSWLTRTIGRIIMWYSKPGMFLHWWSVWPSYTNPVEYGETNDIYRVIAFNYYTAAFLKPGPRNDPTNYLKILQGQIQIILVITCYHVLSVYFFFLCTCIIHANWETIWKYLRFYSLSFLIPSDFKFNRKQWQVKWLPLVSNLLKPIISKTIFYVLNENYSIIKTAGEGTELFLQRLFLSSVLEHHILPVKQMLPLHLD